MEQSRCTMTLRKEAQIFTSRAAARSSKAFRWFPCWGDVFLGNFRWFPCWGDDFLFFVCIWLHLTKFHCLIIIKPGFGTFTIKPQGKSEKHGTFKHCFLFFCPIGHWHCQQLAVSIGCLVGMYGVQWGLQAQLLLVST